MMAMSKLKCLAGTAVAAVMAVTLAGQARADYLFSGSGDSGYLDPPTGEYWQNNGAGWGSPGVSNGITPYTQATQAYGFVIDFTGPGQITPGSIAIGNAAGCAGDSTGGTTFCTISTTDIWEAFQTGPESVEFLAQNASFYIVPGQDYFVNILFTGGNPTSFTGKWLTEFTPSVPEPATMLVLGSALTGLAMARRRKRS